MTFRDDHEASLARADALEAENERLRDELARMKAPPQAEPKPEAAPAPVAAKPVEKPRPKPAPPPRIERSYDPQPRPVMDVSTRNKWIIATITVAAFVAFLVIVLSVV